MFRTQATTKDYINHIVKVIERDRDISLVVEKSFHDYSVTCNETIVWFGRDIDVELLRTTRATAFEDYLTNRLDRLVELGLLPEKKKLEE